MLSKLLKTALISICLSQLSGCATMMHGSHQQLTVKTTNDKMPDKTRCNIKNEEGEWNTEANTTLSIHRDGNTMDVQCENPSQTGIDHAEPKFDKGALAINIWLDLCVISCVIDGLSNAFYEYPLAITVPMQDKSTLSSN